MSRDMRDIQLSDSLDPCYPRDMCDMRDMRDMQIDYQKKPKNACHACHAYQNWSVVWWMSFFIHGVVDGIRRRKNGKAEELIF